MATENIFINLGGSTLAGARAISLTNNQQQAWKKFVIADNRDFNIYFTDGAGAYVDVSAYTNIRVGVGGINKRPTGGTWVFTHGGNDHTFDFDTSASTMETALDASPFSLGVSVTEPTTGVWVVKFDADGAQTLPTTDAYSLTPDSTISVKRLVTGDGSTKEEWIIRLFQVPWAYSDSWADISNGVTGALNFGTENLYKAMASANSLTGNFEVELTDASSNISTVIQAPVTVNGPVIGDGVAGAGAFSSYLTRSYETIILTVTAESAEVVLGTGLITFRMPYAMTLTDVRSSVKTAPTGDEILIDVNEDGSTVLSTKCAIDDGEKSSVDAGVQPVISDSALANDSEITIDVDIVGLTTPGNGLKVYLIGYRA